MAMRERSRSGVNPWSPFRPGGRESCCPRDVPEGRPPIIGSAPSVRPPALAVPVCTAGGPYTARAIAKGLESEIVTGFSSPEHRQGTTRAFSGNSRSRVAEARTKPAASLKSTLLLIHAPLFFR
jgi:hypothetical protein